MNGGPPADLGFGALALLLAIGGPVLLYIWWYNHGRDAPVGLVADYLPEPPSDLPPGVVGTLLDKSADVQDILATILDLARRGAIEIEEVDEPGYLNIGVHRDFVYRRRDSTLAVRPYETLLLEDIFGKNGERKQSELGEQVYGNLPGLRKELYAETVRQGLFGESPEATRYRYRLLGVAGLVAAAVLDLFVAPAVAQYAPTVLWVPIGLGISAFALIVLAPHMPRRTARGAEAAARWLAFKRYLQNLEKYTKVEDAGGIFDRYLPYAAAFGLEQNWIRKFSAVEIPAPTWWIPYYDPAWSGPGGMGRGVMPGGSRVPGQGAFLPGAGGAGPSLAGMSRGLGSSLSGMSAGLGSMLTGAANSLSGRPSSGAARGLGGGIPGRGFSGGGTSGRGFSGGGPFRGPRGGGGRRFR